jgi:DNA repair exonuclease SbcCD nuclease subunit
MIRFIHTADWQIGKPFTALGDVAPQLRAARLAAIDQLATHARSHGIAHVLVAGDIYDGVNLARPTLLGPVERMRAAGAVTWWLLPGNHDPNAAGGLWERLCKEGLPANVRTCLTPEPVEMAPGAWLLPAPLMGKHTARDTTDWMDAAVTPEGAIRIGLAHGSIKDFGQRQESPNVIDPGRIASAKLDWLALGDWHGLMMVGPRGAYPGTPEPDAFRAARTGTALDVTIAGAGAMPVVSTLETGTHNWVEMAITLDDSGAVDDLAARVAREAGSTSVVRLKLDGALAPADWAVLDRALGLIEARVCHLDVRRDRIGLALDDAALAELRFDGLLGQVAGGLAVEAAAGSAVARDALIELSRRTGAL